MRPTLVHDLLTASALKAPDATAVVDAAAATSYRSLDERAQQVALALEESGVRRGDRVILALQNGTDFAACYFGILSAGAVVVPLAGGTHSERLRHALVDCDPVVCISDRDTVMANAEAIGQSSVRAVCVRGASQPDPFALPGITLSDLEACAGRPARRPRVRMVDVDLAAIVYTSGSTGRPRGVMLTHLNIVANTESIVSYLRLTAEDRVMAVLPMHYVYGLSLLHTHVAVGGSVVMANDFAFPNVVLKAMQTHCVTGFAGVPSTFTMLLRRSAVAKMSFPSLRYVTQAGGAMPPARLAEWLQVMPTVPFYVMYGATEASARLSFMDPADLSRRPASIGQAIPNVELKVVTEDGRIAEPREVGELVARGANISSGYWKCPGETQAAFGPMGYRTGDFAYADEDGFLYVVGRKQDFLKVGGHRVGAPEIEHVLNEHASVLEAAVVSAPDDLLGEVPVAFVVLRDGSPPTTADLLTFCRERMSPERVPARIAVLPELPRNDNAKVDKQVLRARARELQCATVASGLRVRMA